MNIEDLNEDKNVQNVYEFTFLDDPALFKNIIQKENVKLLEKWGILQNMELYKYRFNLAFNLKDLKQFIHDFLNSPIVKKTFTPLQFVSTENKTIDNFKYSRLSCNLTNMDFLEPLYEDKIINRETGYIKKDYDDYLDDIQISDLLKQSLLKEESEYYCLLNEEVRNELLFHIFKRIAVGGSLCQYEDTVNEYIEMTKKFYKGI